ncbi:MAG: hypothetical protein ACXAEU_24825 [Candidatus Hodarchaeales archaeon]|jgi:hypothetical protein
MSKMTKGNNKVFLVIFPLLFFTGLTFLVTFGHAARYPASLNPVDTNTFFWAVWGATSAICATILFAAYYLGDTKSNA